MRIGIDARLINETGVGRYIRNLVKELSVVDTTNSYRIFLRADGFSTWRAPNARWKKVLADAPWHSVTEQVKMPRIYYKEKLDLLHVPYFNIPIFYNGKMIITIHDLTIQHFDTGKASTRWWMLYKMKRLLYGFVLSIGIAKAKHIITPSIATKTEIIDHYHVVPDKITVTHEGVDREITKSIPRAALRQPLIALPYFLCVGNAYPHKNLAVVVDALAKSKTDSTIVFVGKIDYFYQRLKKEIENRGLSHRVVFFGAAEDNDLTSFYANADALIFPSLMEGFGLPPLEALSCGCPVIASDIAVHREILKDLVTYFSPHDVTQLTQLLDTWIKADHVINPKRVQSVFQVYNWRTMAESTLRIYESCNRL